MKTHLSSQRWFTVIPVSVSVSGLGFSLLHTNYVLYSLERTDAQSEHVLTTLPDYFFVYNRLTVNINS